ncbi:hypothetical protein ID866_7273 [Astraeus odoratus]|nr:hypothetical protein ID866_7273 [Astraeus odoratus]
MSVRPNKYTIIPVFEPEYAIGVDLKTNSATKPVIVVHPDSPPQGSVWEATVEPDGSKYLMAVDGASVCTEGGKVSALYGAQGERWKLVYRPHDDAYRLVPSRRPTIIDLIVVLSQHRKY